MTVQKDRFFFTSAQQSLKAYRTVSVFSVPVAWPVQRASRQPLVAVFTARKYRYYLSGLLSSASVSYTHLDVYKRQDNSGTS